jgi:hypothetical protein
MCNERLEVRGEVEKQVRLRDVLFRRKGIDLPGLFHYEQSVAAGETRHIDRLMKLELLKDVCDAKRRRRLGRAGYPRGIPWLAYQRFRMDIPW